MTPEHEREIEELRTENNLLKVQVIGLREQVGADLPEAERWRNWYLGAETRTVEAQRRQAILDSALTYFANYMEPRADVESPGRWVCLCCKGAGKVDLILHHPNCPWMRARTALDRDE